MVKRTRSDIEIGDEQEFSTDSGPNLVLADVGVIQSLLRMVMSRHSRNQKLRKEHFAGILRRFNLKGNIIPWIEVLRKETETVFGFTIKQMGNEIVIIDNLELKSRAVLATVLQTEASATRPPLHDQNHFMPRNRRSLTIVNTSDLISGGISMLVICIIVVNENRIRESDLLDALNVFGLSDNLNAMVANLNKNTQDVLSELVKKEYLEKSSPLQGDLSSPAEFSLGKRALREFSPQNILEVLLSMHDQEELRQKCYKTIQRCFPDFCPLPEPREGENEVDAEK